MSDEKIFSLPICQYITILTDCSVGLLDSRRKPCSARKRSVSDKCFICAKAKRQQQMFYLRESEATAAKRVARNGNQPL
ncbi:hypothetical protein [Lysinibacillus xylanilyticus]|uniref:hypothetical protein n=1 Tax=Lysinibacillus xylanilyticus TaxID=582475 RepID=UPI003D0811FD